MPKRSRHGSETNEADEDDYLDRKPAARPTSSRSQETPRDDESAAFNNNNNNDRVTPHMERLLRLVEEGTTESAQMAAGQLAHLTAHSSALVLWEVLGRLHAMLQSMDSWKARQNAAMAMEGVASNLPIIDQQSFFRSDHSNHQQNATTLRISEVSIQDVMDQGMELYVTAPSRYVEQLDQAEEAQLDQLDQKATNFVQERIQSQRKILSQRLGLSAIENALKGKQNPAHDIVSNDDLTATYRKANAKKARQDKTEKHPNALQQILVHEISKAVQESGAASHRDPQHLLANELIFRMFDSVWQRRHGALLGILALIKAWRKTLGLETALGNEEETNFGPWLEDILARSLCLLALDRFGDFSGAIIESLAAPKENAETGEMTATSEKTRAARTAPSGVIAPVRELGAQLFALVWGMAPVHLKEKSITQLVDVLDLAKAWEAQQGALLAIKYVLVLVNIEIKKGDADDSTKSRFERWISTFGKVAGRYLSSQNHDVSGAAARILCEEPSILMKEMSILQSFWNVVRTLDVMATNATDIVALLSSLMRSCPSQAIDTLASIEEVHSFDFLEQLAKNLLRFLDCSLGSVRTCSLTSLELLPNALSKTSLVDSEAMSALYDLIMNKLFAFYVKLTDEMTFSGDEELSDMQPIIKCLDNTWGSFCELSQHFNRSKHIVKSTLIGILVQYYGAPEIISRPSQYHLLMEFPCLAVSELIRHLINCWEIEHMLLSSFRIYLESPWLFHCELACSLLHRLNHVRFSVSFSTELRPIIGKICEELPVCLELSNCGPRVFLDTEEMKQKHRKYVHYVLLDGGDLDEFLPSSIRVLLSGDVRNSNSSKASFDLERMRVRATAAMAGLSLGAIQKITPYVRALMTSIRNEKSECRLERTSCAFSTLLSFLHGKGEFLRATTKIINSLATLSAAGHSDSPVAYNASKALCTYLGQLPRQAVDSAFQSIQYHLVLQYPLKSLPATVEQALLFLGSLLNTSISPVCVDYCIDVYIGPLCQLCCSCQGYESTRTAAQSCLILLCKRDRRALNCAIPFAAKLIEEGKNKTDVLNGCVIIKDLCELSPSHLGPFVKHLLPIALKTMTNPDRTVSHIANAIFAVLVRVAPLVTDETDENVGMDEQAEDRHSSRVLDHLISGKPLPRITMPEEIANSLQCAQVSLRDYQVEGISWVSFLMSVNLNGALCDSMGLGKTIQALVGIALAHRKPGMSSRPISLVVCPATIVNHWVGEIRRFFPGGDIFCPYSIVGDSAHRKHMLLDLNDSQYNLVVLSYETLRSDIHEIEKIKWVFCVLDEGHVLRNPQTATARASRRVPSRHRMVLSGTMIQNKVHDVWATFDFLMPNFLGSSRDFTKTYARPITRSQLPGASAEAISEGMEKLKSLHQQVLPFILRREKEQVLRELPPKNITELRCPLSDTQKRLYDSFASCKEAKESMAFFEKELQEGNENIGTNVLRILLFLRLICTHPSLIDARHQSTNVAPHERTQYSLHSSGKFLALFNLLRDCGITQHVFVAGDCDESLMYCENTELETGAVTCSDIAVQGDDSPLSPYCAVSESPSSPKCLVFAQFSQTLDAVENYLFKPHMPSLRYLRLDGSVPSDRRVDVANRFNRDPSVSVLLLTTRVGSLGLNLTGASIVVFIEHDFNPFVDIQAEDRVHRLGQRADYINIYRLIAEDSIDERIMELQKKKLSMSRAVVNTDNSTLYSMGTDRLLDIFTPKRSMDDDEHVTDLDAILKCYAQDYKSLSVDEFIRNFSLK